MVIRGKSDRGSKHIHAGMDTSKGLKYAADRDRENKHVIDGINQISGKLSQDEAVCYSRCVLRMQQCVCCKKYQIHASSLVAGRKTRI